MRQTDAQPPIVAASAGALKQLASEMIRAWPDSSPFDARNILDARPELRADHSVVLDLAYEEFCRRTEAGEIIAPEAFVQRFPSIQRSLLQQLQVHRFLEANVRPGDAFSPGNWPAPGESFLGFDLKEEIGRGAFSRVFLASEECVGSRTVVVKVSEFGGDEARILGRLDHGGIVPIHSAKRDDATGLWAICMPFLGRSTLLTVLDRIAQAPAPWRSSRELLFEATAADRGEGTEAAREAAPLFRPGDYLRKVLSIGLQLAEALQFAHAAGVCHGDLKPSNVLLTRDGRAMLLDFNLSFGASDVSFDRVGGTLPYMAPEQLCLVAGEAAAPDARTDLFSLAAVLHELLSGTLPFGPLPTELPRQELIRELRGRQRRGPEPLLCLGRPIDPAVGALIRRCLAVDPSERPASAAHLAAELRGLLSASARTRRWARAHWLASSAVLTGTACTAAVALMLWAPAPADHFVGHSARSERAVSRTPLEAALAEAIRAVERGDYREAIARCNAVLAVRANSAEALFWRGRALLLSGAHREAQADFEAVFAQQRSAPAAACLAYTYSLDLSHREAIALYHEAAERGCSTAALWNNLAYSYWKTGEWGEAERCLERAIACDAGLAAIYHNRSQLELRQGIRNSGPEAVQWLRKAVLSIETALESGSASGEIFRDAGCIYAGLAWKLRQTDPSESLEYEQAALRSVHKAIDRGLSREDVESVAPLLRHSREFQSVVESLPRTGVEVTTSSALLVDPLTGSSGVLPDKARLVGTTD